MKKMVFLLVFCVPAVLFAFAGGNGTALNPYQIQTAADIVAVQDSLSAHYVLIADIDMSGNPSARAVVAPDTGSSSDYAFTGTPFSGVFNGAGYKISNLAVGAAASTNDYLGLFGKIDGATISNLTLENCTTTGNRYHGILAGYSNNSTISNCVIKGGSLSAISGSTYVGLLIGVATSCTISGCSVSGSFAVNGSGNWCSMMVGYLYGSMTDCDVSGTASLGASTNQFGGIAGYGNASTLTRCRALISITAKSDCWYIGGVIGESSGTNVSDCMVAGKFAAEESCLYIGGIAGYISGGSYNRCYADLDIEAETQCQSMGGFAGRIYNAPVNNSYSLGGVTADYLSDKLGGFVGEATTSANITNCYSIGDVYHDQYTLNYGGFCGQLNNSTVNNSYWDTQASGLSSSVGGTGATTGQMKNDALFLAAGWDFVGEAVNGVNDYWYMQSGFYPRLAWQPLAGDVDGDGDIDNDDMILMAAQWLEIVEDFDSFAADADMSGFVDYVDFTIFANNRPVL